MRPLIGISTYREQARWGTWDEEAILLPATYADAVASVGGEPVLLPTGATSADVVGRLDGLVLAGGADIEPSRYGAGPHPQVTVTRPDRDAAEFLLLDGALAAELPVLAICRGMQLLNVALGGDLVQHLPDIGADPHDPGAGEYRQHPVRISPDSVIGGLLGDEAIAHCHHHQAVRRLGEGLIAVAWAGDGTVEAVEAEAGPFCVGVQWHPEAGEERRLFAALITAISVAPRR
ncbi:MAG: gamma-glutamyl-gamma-aminobutyrate hydrolase family protein [Frankiales bacterium]|nr:gamma-glutamyl-gamma-aminobutyrate hydrolase family protein [Frankiales bacterium]